ncbi:Splicing factor 3A subunit 1 [Balamuthia mandrillaris]
MALVSTGFTVGSANRAAGSVLVPAGQDSISLEKRNIIDKTADYVARNGPAFEHKIFINERDNPTFSFLNPADPLHSYYKQRIRELKGIGVGASAEDNQLPISAPKAVVAKKTLETKEAEPVQLKPPEPEQWILDLPPISPLELDIIKLVAQFVARNGQEFHIGLVNREQRNQQFDFLRPGHSLHRFYQTLVDHYKAVILPKKDLKEKLAQYKDKWGMLEKLNDRTAWERAQKKNKEADEESNKEREETLLIDWQDFVVVETIVFEEEESAPEALGAAGPSAAAAAPLEEGAPSVAAQSKRAADEDMELEMEVEMDMGGIDDDEEEEIRVVKNEDLARMERERQAAAAANRGIKYSICPKCGQEIPIEEMEEHMKIELLDPEARRKRLELMARRRESTLADARQIEQNLKKLASRRTDIFGEEEVEIGQAVGEDRKNMPEKVIWDGHTGSIAMTASAIMSNTDLLKRKREERDEQPVIGATLPAQQGIAASTTSSSTTSVSSTTSSVSTTTTAPPRSGDGLLATPAAPPMHMHPMRAAALLQPPPGAAPGGFGLPPPGYAHPMMAPPPYGVPPPMHPGAPYPSSLPPAASGTFAAPPTSSPTEEQEPDIKRQRTVGTGVDSNKKELLSEEEFIAQQGSENVSVTVMVPPKDTPASQPEWGFDGQTLHLDMSLRATFKDLKAKIQEELGGMPPAKQKLELKGVGFPKDNLSLAYYNITPEVEVHLGVKARGRGGGKK